MPSTRNPHAEERLKSASRSTHDPRCRPSPLLGLGDRLGDDIRVAAEPLGLLDELTALDLEDLYEPAAFMVRRGNLERRHQTTEAEISDRLEALLNILAGRLLPAVRLGRIADRLDMEGCPQQASVVHHSAVYHLLRLLAPRLVHFPDFLAHRVVVADPGEGHRVIAFGDRPATRPGDVLFARRPDQTEHLRQRVAVGLERLDRQSRRAAEQMRYHEVGAIALRDVEHLCAHLDPGRRTGKGSEVEPFDFLQILDNRDRLATGRVVVEDVGDLFALEAAAQFVLDELDGPGALRPVSRGNREEVGIALAVGRGGDAEAGRGARDLVFFQFLVERLDLRRTEDHDRSGAFALLALIGLDRRRHLVFVVDLHVFDLIALDPALRIDQVVIVLDRRAYDHAVDLRRPGAVAHAADHDLLLLRRDGAGEPQRGRCAGRDSDYDCPYASHRPSSLLLRAELIREWPDPEIISDVAPQPVQPFRLHHQEKNDQDAEQGQPQIGDGVLQVLLREQQPAVILEKPARQDRQQGNEDGAEDRAEDRAQPADDDHRQIVDRHGDLELLVIGDAEVVGVKHPGDAGVEGRDRERPQLVAEDVDADDLSGDVLVADRDEGAADPAADQV